MMLALGRRRRGRVRVKQEFKQCAHHNGIGVSGAAARPAPNPSISIGAENFTENEVLAYVYSDALKAAGHQVERQT